MCEVLGRKKRRRLFKHDDDLFVRCWPMFVEWLEVASVIRVASTCKEYSMYARDVARAWPFQLTISRRDVKRGSGALLQLLSILSPGEKRITLTYHDEQVSVNGFEYDSQISRQLQRLGLFTLDTSYCQIEDPIISTFWCTLRPRRVDSHMCVNVLHDGFIEELAPVVEYLDLSGVSTCEYNPMLSLDGLYNLGKCSRLQYLNLSRLGLVDNTVVKCLRDLPELTELNLQGCHRVTTYTNLNPRLRSLNLSYCGYINEDKSLGILQSLASMEQLEALDLSHNSPLDKEATKFEMLKSMHHLKYLNLASNFHLTNVDNFLPDSLESLNLELCYRVDEASLATALQRLKRLCSLNLSCVGYTQGTTFECIPPTVEHLACSFSHRGVSFQHLRHLTRLQTLDVSVNRIMDASGLAQLSLARLRSLTLRRCDGFHVSNLYCLLHATSLENLHLEDAKQLDDIFFIDIASHFLRLHTLCVRASNITEIGLRSLTLKHLKKLDLADSCLLKGSDLRYLPVGLTSLNIFRCYGIHHIDIDQMKRLGSLHSLFIAKHDQLSPKILQELQYDNPNLYISFQDEY